MHIAGMARRQAIPHPTQSAARPKPRDLLRISKLLSPENDELWRDLQARFDLLPLDSTAADFGSRLVASGAWPEIVARIPISDFEYAASLTQARPPVPQPAPQTSSQQPQRDPMLIGEVPETPSRPQPAPSVSVGCGGCAGRQALMNRIVPGSGDAAKAVIAATVLAPLAAGKAAYRSANRLAASLVRSAVRKT